MLAVALLLCAPVYVKCLGRVPQSTRYWILGEDGSVASLAFRYLVSITVLVLSILEIAVGSYNPFIYFRF